MKQVIIIGSGVAGLYCALQCAQHSRVLLVTKNKIVESSSSYAQGGIAAVLDSQDTFAKHVRDTVIAGAHHNKLAAVRVLVEEAPAHIQQLLNLGVAFSRNQRGKIDLTREGGHSQRRIVHVRDMTGLAVERALISAVRRHHNVVIHEWEFALDLLKHQGKVCGVTTVHVKTKHQASYQADAVVLATGGCGQAYPYTSNPSVVTGDGIAMAVRAGARVKDLEFVQFHPTAYYLPGKPPFLLSEALRGEGAYLRNVHGQRFVTELKPRDVVSRAVYRMQRQGLVYLDLRHRPSKFVRQRFPGIYQRLRQDGLRLDHDLIPITPVAHYLCGGVQTNLHGQSSLLGLYVIGEAAYTGVHGANRLASNSLLECLVFGARAAKHITAQPVLLHQSRRRPLRRITRAPFRLEVRPTETFIGLRQQLQNVMWETGGIVRTKAGLRSGVAEMVVIRRTIQTELKNHTSLMALELYNMATVSEQILQAALKRSHSLGCHYRTN
jgi:L-aspartate oxidase